VTAPSQPGTRETVSEEQIAEWERLASEAAPGPWYTRPSQDDGLDVMADSPAPVFTWAEGVDADFVVAARSAVPALIAEVRSLRREMEGARAEFESVLADVNEAIRCRKAAGDKVYDLDTVASWLTLALAVRYLAAQRALSLRPGEPA
jgi:hypothetical protein